MVQYMVQFFTLGFVEMKIDCSEPISGISELIQVLNKIYILAKN
jgi:hypothetical protein